MITKSRTLLMLVLGLLFCATIVAQRGAGDAQRRASQAASQCVPATGDSRQNITVGGMQRTYIQHLPPGYNSSTARLPLILVLHARTKDAKEAERVSCMSEKADTESFIAVYPQAVGNPTTWNNGLTPVSNNGADDVAFIRGETRTDQNGKYVFDHLPVVSYKVRIKSSEFDEHRRTVTIHANRTTVSNFSVLPLSAPRQRPENQSRAIKQTNVNPSDVSKLLADGSVKGQFTYLRVRPYSTNTLSKSSWTVKVGQSSVHPDEQGNYTITGLASGTYQVTLDGGNRCYVPDPRNRRSVKIRAEQTVTLNLQVFKRC